MSEETKIYKLVVDPAWELFDDRLFIASFETLPELIAAKNSCADMLLFLQDELRVMANYSNDFTLEKLTPEGWFEIDEEGNEI